MVEGVVVVSSRKKGAPGARARAEPSGKWGDGVGEGDTRRGVEWEGQEGGCKAWGCGMCCVGGRACEMYSARGECKEGREGGGGGTDAAGRGGDCGQTGQGRAR